MSGVEAVAWMREGADSVLHNFRFRNPNGGPWIALYSQATVDTLRAQLEAAEAENRTRAEDYARLTDLWKPDEARYVARAEAAEADAQRWRTWRVLDEHAASDIAWAYDAMGRDAAIDAAMARTKEETK